jgi:hypothetical protein
MTTTLDTPIEIGAMGRMLRRTEHLDGGGRSYNRGDTFIIDDYVSAEESEDGYAFYYGSRNEGYGNVCVRARDVEQVMTVEEVRRRELPSTKELLDAVSFQMLGGWGDIDIDETYKDPEAGVVELYGQTAEGLRFVFTLSVQDIQRADF